MKGEMAAAFPSLLPAIQSSEAQHQNMTIAAANTGRDGSLMNTEETASLNPLFSQGLPDRYNGNRRLVFHDFDYIHKMAMRQAQQQQPAIAGVSQTPRNAHLQGPRASHGGLPRMRKVPRASRMSRQLDVPVPQYDGMSQRSSRGFKNTWRAHSISKLPSLYSPIPESSVGFGRPLMSRARRGFGFRRSSNQSSTASVGHRRRPIDARHGDIHANVARAAKRVREARLKEEVERALERPRIHFINRRRYGRARLVPKKDIMPPIPKPANKKSGRKKSKAGRVYEQPPKAQIDVSAFAVQHGVKLKNALKAGRNSRFRSTKPLRPSGKQSLLASNVAGAYL